MFPLTSVIKYKLLLIWIITLSTLVLLSVIHISVGAKVIKWAVIYDAIFHFDASEYMHQIIVKQRMTRLIVAIACGAMLGIAGFATQKLFQNPLVSSSTLGVISGSNFFCVLFIFLFLVKENLLFIPSFLGAVCAGVLTLGMNSMMSKSTVSQNLHIVLAGSLISMLFSSLTVFIMSLDPLRFSGLQSYLLGDIGTSDYKTLKMIFPLGIIGVLMVLSQTQAMDAMTMGDKKAISLGVNIRKTKALVIGATFLLSSVVVSIVGPIGFVGLVIPHIVKLFVNETRYKGMLFSLVFGSIILVLADLIARTLIAPKLLLVGAITASFGGAIFLSLLMIKARKMKGD